MCIYLWVCVYTNSEIQKSKLENNTKHLQRLLLGIVIMSNI